MSNIVRLSQAIRNLLTGLIAHIDATPAQRERAREYLRESKVTNANTIVAETAQQSQRLRVVK